MWIWIWLAVTVACLIIEFSTMEMVSIWSAIAGLVALILAACGCMIEIQLVVFFALSIILLLSLRKFALKFLQKNSTKIGTDSLIGTKHKLLTEIAPDKPGEIKINGIVWTAVSGKNEKIKVNTLVEIIEIKGNKFIVKKGD